MKDKPKHRAFCLMNRKTGDLMEGYRVSLFDKDDLDWSEDIMPRPSVRMSVGFHEHDGWIVYHPKMAPFAIFFNRASEDFFEVLGDL